MTYKLKNNGDCGCSGLGAYYTFRPHEIYGMGTTGFGAIDFDAGQVWADAQEGGRVGQYQSDYQSCIDNSGLPPDEAASTPTCQAIMQKIARANAAGGRAAEAIRRALNELGYGPLTSNVPWGSDDRAAWEAFLADKNIGGGPGLVNRAGIEALEAEVDPKSPPGGGGGGGGGGGADPARAGMGGVGWIVLLLAGGAAAVALVAGKRDEEEPRDGSMVLRR
jgi:hypothetical protein